MFDRTRASIVAIALLSGALLSEPLRNLLASESPDDGQHVIEDIDRDVSFVGLVSTDGTVADRAFVDGWSLVYSGFTSCPTVCPTTLTTLSDAAARARTAALPASLRIVFVTVDPERDDPRRLAEYLKRFNPAPVGLTGQRSALARSFESLGFTTSSTSSARFNTRNTEAFLPHTNVIALVGPGLRLRALFRPPFTPADLAADIRRVVSSKRH